MKSGVELRNLSGSSSAMRENFRINIEESNIRGGTHVLFIQIKLLVAEMILNRAPMLWDYDWCIKHELVQNINLVIPYYGYARQDRKRTLHESQLLQKLVANIWLQLQEADRRFWH